MGRQFDKKAERNEKIWKYVVYKPGKHDRLASQLDSLDSALEDEESIRWRELNMPDPINEDEKSKSMTAAEYWNNRSRTGGRTVHMLTDKDERDVAAFADSAINTQLPGTARISTFIVRSDLRGKGIGRMFMNNIMDKLRSMKFDRVTLSCTQGNERAMNLYERAGFKHISSYMAAKL